MKQQFCPNFPWQLGNVPYVIVALLLQDLFNAKKATYHKYEITVFSEFSVATRLPLMFFLPHLRFNRICVLFPITYGRILHYAFVYAFM